MVTPRDWYNVLILVLASFFADLNYFSASIITKFRLFFLGFDERATNEQAAWDLVRRTLTLGLRLARVKSPNLFRLFYSESRDSNGPTNF